MQKLHNDFDLTPITAAEIEFYIPPDCHPGVGRDPGQATDVLRMLGIDPGLRRDDIIKVEKERGENQWEIAFVPATPQQTIAQLLAFKANQREADFRAKPFLDQPGSGLHIHIHLENAQGKNVFYKDDERMSDELKYSLGGLLNIIPESMPIYAPTEEDRGRFEPKPGSHSPSALSWGANNRTCALRLPDSDHDHKRIEHRVAGANADPEKVMVSILEGIYRGLTQKLDPGAQVYGDAHLEMYVLKRLLSF